MNRLLIALKAAGESTRLRILSILKDTELTVSELVEILDQSQPRVSRHLKLLCDSGLLERYQEGARVFHRIADRGEMAMIATTLIDLVNHHDQELHRDHDRLTEIKARNAQIAQRYFQRNASEWDSIRSRMVDDIDIEARLIDLFKDQIHGLFLDLGTGTGRMLEIFSPYFQRGIGVDLSREMLQVARANLDGAAKTNCTVRQHDIRQLVFEDNSVDTIMIHQVLHYLDRPDEVLDEALRVVKPGGHIIVVDFLPHDLEFLREKHAHRRLGISMSFLELWAKRRQCKLTLFESLNAEHGSEQDTLTVGLWQFSKPLTLQTPR